MALTRRSLKGLIEFSDLRNVDGIYTKDDVIGVSTDKCMISTKADLDGVNLLNYKLFSPSCFAFVADTSRRGDKIALAYNNTEQTFIVSTWYVVFRVCDDAKDVISPDYLFMYFNRAEFDRYARFNSWGSAREYFWFSDMENIIIEIPPLAVQKKYVEVYNSILSNQRSYEQGLEDLKLTVNAIIEKFKHKTKRVFLGDLVEESDVRNVDDASGADLTKYKIVRKGQFACNLMHVGRDAVVPIALQDTDKPLIVSPAYLVFSIKYHEVLPEYVLMWLSRIETDRYAWFMSDTSVRSGMEKERFYEIDIPVPTRTEQELLIEIYIALSLRREISEQLKVQIKDLCPILIKGSLEEGNRIGG